MDLLACLGVVLGSESHAAALSGLLHLYILAKLLLGCLSSTQHFPIALGLNGDWEKAGDLVFVPSLSLE